MANLTGKLINAKSEPVTDAFSITLYSIGIVQAANKIYLGSQWDVTPDETGEFTIDLWNNLEADNVALYQVEHPGGIKYRLSIPGDVITGDYADYILLDDEVEQNPGVLVRLNALENTSPVVLQPRVDALELSQAAQDVTIGNIQSTITALDILTQSHSTEVVKIPGIQSDVADVEIVASDNASDIDTLTNAVSVNNSQISSLQSSIGNKADQADLDVVDGRVTVLEDGVGEVGNIPGIRSMAVSNLTNIESLDTRLTEAEVETAKVDGIQTQVTANYNQISTNASDITGKASQTLVDSLSTTFNSHIHTGTVWTASQIPSLPASQITSGVFSTARIPSLPASQITSEVFSTARIPSLPASQITSEVFSTDRIPSLPASQITSGTLATSVLPSSVVQTSGNFTLAGNIQQNQTSSDSFVLYGSSPSIRFQDNDGLHSWWTYSNGDNWYVLTNYGDGTSSWSVPHPLQLTSSTEEVKVFGYQIHTEVSIPVEDGSWTPYFTTGTGWTYASQIGSYSRIGKLVHIYNSKISVSAADTTATAVTIGGLPFLPTGNDWNWNLRLRNTVGFPLNSQLTLTSSTDGNIRLQVTTGSTMAFASVTNSQMANNMELWFSGTYVTNDI